ncbi:CRAL/TRIO domain-containing protein [Martensiomyces pterosporus]|nr:CRAL/TRIO domain-containing protein [Martensiomyces pterosporus]
MSRTDNTEDVQECYKNGAKSTSGTVGHLTPEQEQKLKELWAKTLAHFDATSGKPIKVTNDQIKATNKTGDSPEAVAKWYAANSDTVNSVKYQTVADRLYLDGKKDPVVPSTFKPLFHDNLSTRDFRNTFWQAAMVHQHPDSYLLAFLRSRNWDVDLAFDRLAKSVQWRASQAIDELVWYGESAQHYKSMDDGLTYISGTDRVGCPVAIVRVRLNIPRERGEGVIERYATLTLERASLTSRANGGRTVLIYDLTSFRMENIEIAFIKTIITLINDSYPDTFQAIILHVNSWLFSGVWKLISPWFDPVIAKRTYFTKNTRQLEQFIDNSQIVLEMGGSRRYEHKYVMPSRAENEVMFDSEGRHKAEEALLETVTGFEKETKAWLAADGPSADLAASRAISAAAFAAASANLDPYVRARFLAERVGIISSDGKIAA